MKRLSLLIAILALAALPARADTYVNTSSIAGVWDSTTAQIYKLCPPGQPGGCDYIVDTTAPQTLSNKTLTSSVITSATGVGQNAVATTTTLSALTSTTTLAPITGLAVPVTAGATYYCTTYLPITAGGSGGVQVAFAGSGGMTATSANYQALTSTTTVNNAMSNTTTFGNAVGGYTGAADTVNLRGEVVVNAGGNLVVEGAQNASNGTATDFLAGATLVCIRTN